MYIKIIIILIIYEEVGDITNKDDNEEDEELMSLNEEQKSKSNETERRAPNQRPFLGDSFRPKREKHNTDHQTDLRGS